MPDRWPDALWLVRHAESAGNVARDAAEAGGLPLIEIAERDMDVALSPRGARQAEALAAWLATLPADARPDVVLTSPYARAAATADALAGPAGLDLPARPRRDERLREREFGVLDRLTRAGIEQRFPEQAELRRVVGKFYHRPPGGESWCDVGLRVRSALDTLRRDHAGRRVLVVTHEVVVKMARYVLEDMDERAVLAIDDAGPLGNCAVTRYRRDGDGLRLEAYNDAAPVAELGAPVTATEDAPVARA